ncbi:MAG: hypothetical protein ACT4QC_23060 [Planctomycetaceae bacterium]
MTRMQLASLACKVLALYCFVHAFTALVQFVLVLVPAIWDFACFGLNSTQFGSVTTVGSYVVAMLVPAAWLWRNADHLARRMVFDDSEPVTPEAWSAEICLSVACTAIGVFAVMQALQQLLLLTVNSWSISPFPAGLVKDPRHLALFLGQVLYAALGGWLILGSRGVARLLIWAREAGGSKKQPTEATRDSDAGEHPTD